MVQRWIWLFEGQQGQCNWEGDGLEEEGARAESTTKIRPFDMSITVSQTGVHLRAFAPAVSLVWNMPDLLSAQVILFHHSRLTRMSPVQRHLPHFSMHTHKNTLFFLQKLKYTFCCLTLFYVLAIYYEHFPKSVEVRTTLIGPWSSTAYIYLTLLSSSLILCPSCPHHLLPLTYRAVMGVLEHVIFPSSRLCFADPVEVIDKR